MEKEPVITFANWGNYTIAFKALFEYLGMKVVLPEKTNPQVILEGAKISPEMFCFPFKVNLGNYLSAIRNGANTIFMVTASGGSCRLRYYAITQDKILKELGEKVHFIILDQGIKDIFSKVKKFSQKSIWQILKAAKLCLEMIFFIEKLEQKAAFLRPREVKEGETDLVFSEAMKKLEKVKNEKDFKEAKKEILQEFSQIETKKILSLPKIGIVGEIYTVCDPGVNFEIERKLGREGVEVHKEITLSYHLSKKFLFVDWRIQRKIKKYLGSTVGGHGRDAIYEMLKYIKKGFDGVIQLLPAFCMPETTVRPILEKIHQETGIPFLSLSFDEEVAEAGIDTRLEAFVDVVKNYHQRKNLKI